MAARRKLALGKALIKQSPLLIWLVVLWVLLWDAVTPLTVASGVVLAVLVTRVLYLPPVELNGRFNVYWLGVFIGHLARDVVVASVQVAVQAFLPRIPRSSIIAVSLHTNSDIVLTVTAQATSLVPGSVVIDLDRANSILFLHAFGADDAAKSEQVRRAVLRTEERLVRAFGSRDDIWRINMFRVATDRQPLSHGRRQREYEAERGLS